MRLRTDSRQPQVDERVDQLVRLGGVDLFFGVVEPFQLPGVERLGAGQLREFPGFHLAESIPRLGDRIIVDLDARQVVPRQFQQVGLDPVGELGGKVGSELRHVDRLFARVPDVPISRAVADCLANDQVQHRLIALGQSNPLAPAFQFRGVLFERVHHPELLMAIFGSRNVSLPLDADQRRGGLGQSVGAIGRVVLVRGDAPEFSALGIILSLLDRENSGGRLLVVEVDHPNRRRLGRILEFREEGLSQFRALHLSRSQAVGGLAQPCRASGQYGRNHERCGACSFRHRFSSSGKVR